MILKNLNLKKLLNLARISCYFQRLKMSYFFLLNVIEKLKGVEAFQTLLE